MKFSIALGAGVASSIFVLIDSTANAATETVVYSFCNQLAETCANGSNPYSPLTDVNGLLNVNGTLYGTTDAGGTDGHGTAFSFDPKTNIETVLHSFGSSGDGANPEMVVPIEVKGVLYGTTAWGGAYSGGTAFSINPQSGTETVLHSFQNNGSDGYMPWTGLIYVHALYGVTPAGGSENVGTVYSVDPQNGDETVRYSFTTVDGDTAPFASLLNYRGMLYGTAHSGGMFSFDPETNVEMVVIGGATLVAHYST